MRAAASRRSEGVSELPPLPQRGDERRVAVLLVVHRTRLDPRRHDDGGDPVAGAVELEAELARRCGRVGRRDRPGRRRGRRFRPARPSRSTGPCSRRWSPSRTASPCRRRRSATGTPHRPGSTTEGRHCRARRRAPGLARLPGGSPRDPKIRHGSMNEKSGRSPLAASASNSENGTKFVAKRSLSRG